MTDDAEVSEEVIRQMGNEIIRLREQLAALRNPSGRVDDTDQLLALIAQEKKRADDAVLRTRSYKPASCSERPRPPASPCLPRLSLSPSSTRASPSKSRQCNLLSNAISGSASREDWVHDDPKLPEQLKEVVRERDAALLELSQLKQSMRDLELGSDLEGGLSDSDDNDETHGGWQMQIARSISQELVLTSEKDSGTLNGPITTIPSQFQASDEHVNANIAPILSDLKETRVLKSVLNTNGSQNDPLLLTPNKPKISSEMQRTSPLLYAHVPPMPNTMLSHLRYPSLLPRILTQLFILRSTSILRHRQHFPRFRAPFLLISSKFTPDTQSCSRFPCQASTEVVTAPDS
ncbi:hypothetical protein BS47DRAFT_15212 [Hydnum rufescens UP504]|uniref:Uncharacterized protein n=1 Tax=Hydnum rufescens UP504 TaxID=1448309 RepID=A0A9P6E029_9AGAM|nr:hypothetical protein BS47DRAFT_15212 [Hydnum rufescens UP504]